jgi:hypothetical protein
MRITDGPPWRLREWLNENHKVYIAFPVTDKQFSYWLTDAEEGQGVVEIPGLHSVSGAPMTFRVQLEQEKSASPPKTIAVRIDLDLISESTYDALLDAFRDQMRMDGHDPERFVMDEWEVTCTAEERPMMTTIDSFAHTPAPWALGSNGATTKVIDADGKAVCMLTHRKDHWNGDLIAAAPLLLEALQNVTRCVSMSGPLGMRAYLISGEFMAAARAAIAAATDTSAPIVDLAQEHDLNDD